MSGTGAPKTNGMAIAGFVCSLVGCLWPLGLIFSIVGMNQTSKDPSQGGRGLAIAGLIISIICAVATVIWWGAFAALLGMESSGY